MGFRISLLPELLYSIRSIFALNRSACSRTVRFTDTPFPVEAPG
jgi:hypothetical protein